MSTEDLKVGKSYRAKKFKGTADGPNNDRIIVWMGVDTIQYDSDTVRNGRRCVDRKVLEMGQPRTDSGRG